MTRVKEFFGIEGGYKFEYNDLRALITVVNVILIMIYGLSIAVILIMIYGLSIAWFGLAVAGIGVVKDLAVDRHINGLVMHLANVALNLYFIILLI